MGNKLYAEYGETDEYEVEYRKKAKLVLSKMANNDARKEPYEFNLTAEEMYFPVICPVLGIPINYYSTKACPNSPSFDRVDNNKGYTLDNVRIISNRANTLKNNGTAEEHRRIAEYMEAHAEWQEMMKK